MNIETVDVSENKRVPTMASALVIVDVQSYFTQPTGSFDSAADSASADAFYARVDDLIIPNLQRLLGFYRDNDWPIYFTEMGSLRADGADLPRALRNVNAASFSATGQAAIPRLNDLRARIDERIEPAAGEVVIRKTTTGTLASSPLAQNLRALDCLSVRVTGIVTDCCVSQTARELADQDFDVSIVEDACGSFVTAHHRAVLEIFANFYGAIESTTAVIEAP